MEKSQGHNSEKYFEILPHSEVVKDVLEEFSRKSKDLRRKFEWLVNSKVLKSNTAPRSYKFHKQYWPTTLPVLDEAANRVGMTSGKDVKVPVSYLETTEKLARQAVTVVSHCDLFLAATDGALDQENFNVASLKNLLLAASRTARHSCALGVAISANTLHWRKNAALSTSRILLPSSKDSLRAAPLDSDTLFGNLFRKFPNGIFQTNIIRFLQKCHKHLGLDMVRKDLSLSTKTKGRIRRKNMRVNPLYLLK